MAWKHWNSDTSGEAMDIGEKIDMVLEWADSEDAPRDFDTSFVESLQEQFEDRGWLSDRQEEALDNIINKFGIRA